MTGIEKILNKIDSDTKYECDDILKSAQIKADRIIADARTQADKISLDIQADADKKCADIANRAESLAMIDNKRIMLNYKQNAITDTINTAVSHLKGLPDNEYFDLIYKMIGKYATQDDGIICFNSADISRLPSDFISKANSVSNGRLTLSDEPCNIDSGFVLVYGDIEQNCSFDAVVLSNYESISDRISHILF